MDFAHFWCTGVPWGVIYKSQIFSFYDQNLRFYGHLKFLEFKEFWVFCKGFNGHNSNCIYRNEVILVSIFKFQPRECYRAKFFLEKYLLDGFSAYAGPFWVPLGTQYVEILEKNIWKINFKVFFVRFNNKRYVY